MKNDDHSNVYKFDPSKKRRPARKNSPKKKEGETWISSFIRYGQFLFVMVMIYLLMQQCGF